MTTNLIRRRMVVIGAAAATASLAIPVRGSSPRQKTDIDLVALGRELARLRRSVGVLERRMEEREGQVVALCAERDIPLLLPNGMRSPGAEAVRVETGQVAAWKEWSATIDVAERVADRLRAIPAESPKGLAVKYDALWWSLYHDRPDQFEARRLAAFGRELRALARNES